MTTSINHSGAIQSYTQTKQGLLINNSPSQIAITVLTDQIIRVRLAPQGQFAPRRSWAVTPSDESFAEVPFKIIESDGILTLKTSAVSVQIAQASSAIGFVDDQGQIFCKDAEGFGWRDGSPVVECYKCLNADEHFYGFGERADQLDQTGRRITNYTSDRHRYAAGTDPLYIAIPIFLSVRPGLAYGVFLNNTWRSQFDMGATNRDWWNMRVEGGELDYYVAYGPTPAEVLNGFGQLLGRTPLPPRWALGYHQSRYSYETEEAVRQMTGEMRRREIPCDVVHFDIHYMDDYRDFTWHPERFPNPKKLIDDLAQDGFKVVTIVDPGVKIDPNYVVYKAGIEQGMFIHQADGNIFHGFVWPDDSVFPDFTRPEVRQWWGQMQDRMVSAGVAGIWNDMNEPTVFELPFSKGGGAPKGVDANAVQGPAGELTTHAEVHNLYGSEMSEASYEGLRQSTSKRPFVLTRAAFAGIQRWSACWMGDNTARWEHLEMAMPQLMNMGLSGVPFVGTDIGGFFDNTSGELFARWMQFGALMPFSRGHTAVDTGPHEPWVFGPQVEAICREYLQLRYHLLPYAYTAFWESSQNGAPVLRPLVYEFPNDPVTYQIHDQVLVGSSILAAPVYQPGRIHRAVYLPQGDWYDWWTEALLTGPLHLLADAPLDRMPLYVRAGAILPSGRSGKNAAEVVLDPLTLDCYWGDGDYTLYEDDGESFAFEQGEYCTTHYKLNVVDGHLHISGAARVSKYGPAHRTMRLRVHGVSAAIAGNMPEGTYDPAQRIWTLEREDEGTAFEVVL